MEMERISDTPVKRLDVAPVIRTHDLDLACELRACAWLELDIAFPTLGRTEWLLARASLASDSLPSAEAFAETVQRCLDELAGAHAAGTLVPVERDRAWRRAARRLAIADEHAQATLP